MAATTGLRLSALRFIMIICSFYNTVEEQKWYADVSRDIAEYRLKQCDKVVLSLSYLVSTHKYVHAYT